MDEDWDEEVLALRAIYGEDGELMVRECAEEGTGIVLVVEMALRPNNTAEEREMFVKATLNMQLPSGYPLQQGPVVTLKDVRGMDEDGLRQMHERIREKMDGHKGEPVLFDLVETVRDVLNENNAPQSECTVCLMPMAREAVVRAGCYHCFHDVCLQGAVDYQTGINRERAMYREQSKRKASPEDLANEALHCPICRTALDEASLHRVEQTKTVSKAGEPSETSASEGGGDAFEIPVPIRAWQAEAVRLWQLQREAGGIIDIEENKRKLFVSNTLLPIPAEYTAKAQAAAPSTTPTTAQATAAPKQRQHQQPRNNQKKKPDAAKTRKPAVPKQLHDEHDDPALARALLASLGVNDDYDQYDTR